MMRDKITKEILWSISSKGVSFLLLLALNVFIARKLGVATYGIWSYFYSVVTIVFTFSFMGINRATEKFLAENIQTAEIKNIIRSSLILRLSVSLIASLIFLLFYKKTAEALNLSDYSGLFFYASFLIFTAGAVEYLKSVFSGLHRLKYNFFVNCTEYGCKLALVFLFLKDTFRLVDIVIAFLVSLAVAALAGLILLFKNFYFIYKTDTKKNYLKDIIMYSCPLIFLGMGFLAATEIDVFMLGLLSSSIEVGVYSAAKQLVIKLPHISVAVAMGIIPVFAKITKDNAGTLSRLFKKMLLINSFIFLAVIIILNIYLENLIVFLFGSDYLGSVLTARILLVVIFFYSFLPFLTGFLDYQGMAWKRAGNFFFSVILNIVLNYVLIPSYGAYGAAISTAVSYVPYVILNFLAVRKRFQKEILSY